MEVPPPFNTTNVQSGQIYIPMNENSFMIYYTYLYKSETHDKNIANIPVVLFKIVNGEYIFQGTNPYVKLIMERESDPPVIDVKTTSDPDSLRETATDANLKSISYSAGGGAKKSLTSGVGIKMGLSLGTHTIDVIADDYFRLNSKKTIQRTITAPVNKPPVITITSPTEGTVYDNNPFFICNITDTDFASASYSINGGAKTSINQSVSIPLSLPDGLYKIIVEATDKKPQTAKDSVSFKMDRSTTIDDTTLEKIILYPNPVHDQLNIKYRTGMSGNAYRETFSIDGRLMDKKQIGSEIEEIINMEEYKGGVYILRITDGKERQNLKFIKE